MGAPHFEGIPPASAAANRESALPQTDDPRLRITTLLCRAADCLRAALHDCTLDAGLNESRFQVLDALQREPTGACSQSRLARFLLQSESNLSTLLERMRADGLVSRERSLTDRRCTLVALTAAGNQTWQVAIRARQAALARLLPELGDFVQQGLASGLLGLTPVLERAASAPFGVRQGRNLHGTVNRHQTALTDSATR